MPEKFQPLNNPLEPGQFCPVAGQPAQIEARLRGEGTPTQMREWREHLAGCTSCRSAAEDDATLKVLFTSYRNDPFLAQLGAAWKPDLERAGFKEYSQNGFREIPEIPVLPSISGDRRLERQQVRRSKWSLAFAAVLVVGALGIALVLVVLATAPGSLPGSNDAFWQNGGIMGLNNPSSLAVDGKGNLYVTETGGNRVIKYAPNGTLLAQWGKPGAGDGEFNNPWGIAANSQGQVYVVDSDNARVQIFDQNGKFLGKWGRAGTGAGQFERPSGLAIDRQNNVFVVDTGNLRLEKFDKEGKFLAQWGKERSGDGQFSVLRSVAVDPASNFYLLEWGFHRIQKFDSNGNFLAKWGGLGQSQGQFNKPWGIAIDAQGNVYVTEQDNNRVQKFDTTGALLATWGSLGSATGQLKNPTGIAVDAQGYIYVVDNGNNRIQRFH